MTPESKKLLNQFASALNNELIYGEIETASLKRCREYAAKTKVAREALEAHIECLEGAPAAQGDAMDAARYRWLKSRFTGYDFYWMGKPPYEAEEDQGKCVIVFECGQDFNAGRDFESGINAAMATQQAQATPNDPKCSGCDPAEGFCKDCREAEKQA